MPYLSSWWSDPKDEGRRTSVASSGDVGGAPGGGSAPQGQSAGAPQSGQPGTGFTNLQGYLGANPGANAGFAQGVSGSTAQAAKPAISDYQIYLDRKKDYDTNKANIDNGMPIYDPKTARPGGTYAAPLGAEPQEPTEKITATRSDVRSLSNPNNVAANVSRYAGSGYSPSNAGFDSFLMGPSGFNVSPAGFPGLYGMLPKSGGGSGGDPGGTGHGGDTGGGGGPTGGTGGAPDEGNPPGSGPGMSGGPVGGSPATGPNPPGSDPGMSGGQPAPGTTEDPYGPFGPIGWLHLASYLGG